MAGWVDPVIFQETVTIPHEKTAETLHNGTVRTDASSFLNQSCVPYYSQQEMDNGFDASQVFTGSNPYKCFYTLDSQSPVHTLYAVMLYVQTSNGSGGAITTLPAEFWLSRFVILPQGTVSNNEAFPVDVYFKQNFEDNPREAFYRGLTTYTDNDPSAAATSFGMFTSTTSVANGATSSFWYEVPDPMAKAKIPLFGIDPRNAPKYQFETSLTFQNTGGDFTCTSIDVYLFGIRYTPAVLNAVKSLYAQYPLLLKTIAMKRNYLDINFTANTEISPIRTENVEGMSAFLLVYAMPQNTTNINQITNGASGLLQFTQFSLKGADSEYFCDRNIPEVILNRIWPRIIPSPGFFWGARNLYVIPFSNNMDETLKLNMNRGSYPINNDCILRVTPAATTANCTLYYVNFCYSVFALKKGVCYLEN